MKGDTAMFKCFLKTTAVLFFMSIMLTPSFGKVIVEETQKENNLYYGFGVGLGSAGITVKGANLTFNEELTNMGATSVDALISLNFKIGGKLSRKLWIGFDGTIATQNGPVGFIKVNTQVINMLALLTYYPYEKGFFMRGGAGWANYSESASFGTISAVAQKSGLGILAGLGYAFQVQDNFNITANVDYTRQSYSAGSDGLTASQATLFYAGFDWY